MNPIECVWLGEDDLFAIHLTLPTPELNWVLVTFTGSQSMPTEPNASSDESAPPVSRRSDNPITIASNSTRPAGVVSEAKGVESLNDCAGWFDIDREDFEQFTNALKEFGIARACPVRLGGRE